jgi:hypothetical protein
MTLLRQQAHYTEDTFYREHLSVCLSNLPHMTLLRQQAHYIEDTFYREHLSVCLSNLPHMTLLRPSMPPLRVFLSRSWLLDRCAAELLERGGVGGQEHACMSTCTQHLHAMNVRTCTCGYAKIERKSSC